MWMHGMGWVGWLLMSLATIALWALVAVALVALFGAAWGAPARKGSDDTAKTILDQRFARGEIDAEEYRSRIDALRATH